MIYYNLNTINDWNFGDDNIIKVYKHGAVVFYKFDSEQGGYKVCYAVVDDISQYSDTEFEDVFNKADGLWYKLNNLTQYEQYGIYGSGRTITTYEGKLTIDGDYEYQYSGGSWVNVGEVSGSSRVPDGYVELTHVQTIKQDVSSASAFTIPIDIQSSYNYIIEFMPLDWSNNSYYGPILGNDGDTNFPSYGLFKLDNGWGTEWNRTIASFWNYSFDSRRSQPADSKYRFYDNTKARVTMHLHNYDAAQGADMIVENEGYPTSAVTSTSVQKSGYVVSTGVYNSPLFCTQTINMITTAYMNFYNLKIETNENVAVYDYIPCKRKSDNKVGLYDVVHNVFHAPLFKLNAGDEASHTEYPKYYSEKSEPLNNLTFNTMAEAQAYAEANCVYVGLKAAINGDKYVFSGDSQSGYEWVYNPSRLPVGYTEVEYIENVTPNKAYIDTGFKPNQNTRVIADLQYVTTNTHPRAFGCGAWNSVGYIFNAENGIPGEWRWKFGSNGNTWLTTGVASDFNRHKVEINNGNLYLDDVVIGSTTVTTFQLTDNIGLFGFIQNGSQGGTSAGEYMFGKFYSFKVYDNGTLERDLVPCKRDSDDKYGMYDIVNDVFYVSPNGNNFSGGNPV